MDETRELLSAILKNQEEARAEIRSIKDELLQFRAETNQNFKGVTKR